MIHLQNTENLQYTLNWVKILKHIMVFPKKLIMQFQRSILVLTYTNSKKNSHANEKQPKQTKIYIILKNEWKKCRRKNCVNGRCMTACKDLGYIHRRAFFHAFIHVRNESCPVSAVALLYHGCATSLLLFFLALDPYYIKMCARVRA